MAPTSPNGNVVDEKWWTENMPTYEGESTVKPHRDEPFIPGFWLFTPEKRERMFKNAHVCLSYRCDLDIVASEGRRY